MYLNYDFFLVPDIYNGKTRKSVCEKLAEKLGVQLERYNVVTTHCLPSTRNATSDIRVKFHYLETKVQMMRAAIHKKPRVGYVCEAAKDVKDRIYQNSHLTKHIQALIMRAKCHKEEEAIKSVWEQDGKVFIRKRGDSQLLRVWDTGVYSGKGKKAK